MKIVLAALLLAQAQAPSDDPATMPATLDGMIRVLPGYTASKEAKLAGDEDFLKRLFKDLLGGTPSAEDVKAFVDDAAPNKRVAKIDQLVADPRFDDFWARRFTEVFFGNAEALKIDLAEKPPGTEVRMVKDFERWLREQIAKNTPWNEITRQMIKARGSLATEPAAAYVLSFNRGNGLAVEFTEGVSRQFLGIRMYCARCHDHPMDKWTVEDYYAMSAFVVRFKSRVVDGVVETGYRDGVEQFLPVGPSNKGFDVKMPAGGQITPRFLSGGGTDKDDDRTMVLGLLMAQKANTQLPRMLSNRIWGWLFGTGLLNPIDDFSLKNKSVAPALQQELVRQTIALNHSIKGLVRVVCSTKEYQRETPEQAPDAESFRHFMARRPTRGVLTPMGKGAPLPLSLGIPEAWIRTFPASGMKAVYRIPGKADGSQFAEVALFEGKKAQSFVERAPGRFIKPKTATQTLPGAFMVTVHEIAGIQTCVIGADGPRDRVVLAAQLDSPEASWTIRFEGPAAVVNEWRAEFLVLLQSAAPR